VIIQLDIQEDWWWIQSWRVKSGIRIECYICNLL